MSTPADGVLAGRRVVVTRAAAQAAELADLLRAHGADPVVVPLVETVTDPAAQAVLAALDPMEFEWLVVTSPNGARHYRDAHPQRTPAQVAAVGASTAAALDDVVTLVPSSQHAAGLLAEFPRGVSRVLLVQAAGADPALADGLRGLGWQVTVVAPYRTAPSRPAAGALLRALSSDAVLFAAGSAARAWVEVFGTSTPPVVVAIGPQTASAATAAGLKVTCIAADHSLEGLVETLVAYLGSRE